MLVFVILNQNQLATIFIVETHYGNGLQVALHFVFKDVMV